MKDLVTRSLLAVLLLAAVPACESNKPNKPKKPKPVPPSSDLSGQPWNRPRSWENGGRFGGMMPQSR
jgi:hypothetical protein